MPIVTQLDRLLLERRMTLTELADRVGVTIANLSILKTNKARAIRFSTLEAICRELRCQPGDLLVYLPQTDRMVDCPRVRATVHARQGKQQDRTKIGNALQSRSQARRRP